MHVKIANIFPFIIPWQGKAHAMAGT